MPSNTLQAFITNYKNIAIARGNYVRKNCKSGQERYEDQKTHLHLFSFGVEEKTMMVPKDLLLL
jgi:hypothetical protein